MEEEDFNCFLFLIYIRKNMLPPAAWNDITPKLFTTFWTLSLYDLQVPMDSYKSVHKRLRQDDEVSQSCLQFLTF